MTVICLLNVKGSYSFVTDLLCCVTQQGDLNDAQKYSGVTSRNSDVGPVVIRDVSALMPIHQSLGQAYT